MEVIVEFETHDGAITKVTAPTGCKVHVYDYHRKWSKNDVEPDGRGGMAKQTIFLGLNTNPDQIAYQFRIYALKDGTLKVFLPKGTVVLGKVCQGKGEPVTRRWVNKDTQQLEKQP